MNVQTRAAKQISGGAAPERGSFPLDHLHECDHTVYEYYVCLKKNKYFAQKCRVEMKSYLNCRVDKRLMSHDDYRTANLPDINAPIADFDIEDLKKSRKVVRRTERVGGVGDSGINWDEKMNE